MRLVGPGSPANRCLSRSRVPKTWPKCSSACASCRLGAEQMRVLTRDDLEQVLCDRKERSFRPCGRGGVHGCPFHGRDVRRVERTVEATSRATRGWRRAGRGSSSVRGAPRQRFDCFTAPIVPGPHPRGWFSDRSRMLLGSPNPESDARKSGPRDASRSSRSSRSRQAQGRSWGWMTNRCVFPPRF